MAVLSLVIAPDPRLTICSERVDVVNDDIRRFMDDMVDTMRHEEGIGLAAVQVGVHKRILVMEIPYEDQDRLYFMINPEIVTSSEEENVYKEGCLSFPGQSALVKRPATVTVSFLNYHGEPQTLTCDGLLATCVQHEMDHLNGVVFVDHITKLRRDMIMARVRKLKKGLEN